MTINVDHIIEQLEKSLNSSKAEFDNTFQLARLYRIKGNYPKSLSYISQALRIRPDSMAALSQKYFLKHALCNWIGLDKLSDIINKQVEYSLKNKIAIEEMPYENITRSQIPLQNLNVAQFWSKTVSDSIQKFKVNFSYSKNTRIKIGYLTCEWGKHPVSQLLHDIFEYHSKDIFETYAYSYGDNVGPYYDSVNYESDNFIDLSGLDVLAAAKRINNDGVDILIDLMGFTGDARPEIFALRPAPVQISYLGFPGTTGSNYLDYIITDAILTPPGQQKYYTEKFLYLPCYQFNSKITPSSRKFTRKEFNIPQKSVVFASFNGLHKIEPEIFSAWMEILKSVPQSVLMLWESNKFASQYLIKRSRRAGIDPKRLIFTQRITLEDHLARINLVDIALDTFPYNGGATTSNILRMGIPLVTIRGKTYISRMSTSLLTFLGFTDLIAEDIADYINIAVRLGNDPLLVKRLKVKILNSSKSKLFNPKLNTTVFENALIKIYQDYISRL